MRQYEETEQKEAEADSAFFKRFRRWIECLEISSRLIASWFGLLLIAGGLYVWWKLFSEVIRIFNDPKGITPLYERWTQAIKGSDKTIISWPDGQIDIARPLAVLVMVVLVWLIVAMAFKIVKVGTDIISWTLSDRLAIKRLIYDAYNKTTGREITATKKWAGEYAKKKINSESANKEEGKDEFEANGPAER